MGTINYELKGDFSSLLMYYKMEAWKQFRFAAIWIGGIIASNGLLQVLALQDKDRTSSDWVEGWEPLSFSTLAQMALGLSFFLVLIVLVFPVRDGVGIYRAGRKYASPDGQPNMLVHNDSLYIRGLKTTKHICYFSDIYLCDVVWASKDCYELTFHGRGSLFDGVGGPKVSLYLANEHLDPFVSLLKSKGVSVRYEQARTRG